MTRRIEEIGNLAARENDNETRLIANSKATGGTLLGELKRQLASCTAFDFCVAFVADGGLQVLVESFNELKARGVRGRLLTSTYLSFNSPDAYRKLLEYDNIDVRVYQGNLHAKGYVFDEHGASTVIVGSSNMTQMALTCNREWNVLYRSFDRNGFLSSICSEFNALWNDRKTVALTDDWIDDYARARAADAAKRQRRETYFGEENQQLIGPSKLEPNKMQKLALEALAAIHKKEEPRALLVSATGTGKTFLSAFDVLAVKPRRVLFLAHRQRILQASLKSYQKLLGNRYSYAMYRAGSPRSEVTCLFAMCSSVSPHLDEFNPGDFDYIVIDEAHRTGSASYQKIMAFFKPKFYLGMTATPNRTDGYDVFALFNHVIAFQITLQDALENDMLVPFHYFGISDIEIDDEAVDDPTLFNKLTSDDRVQHIVSKIEQYSVAKQNRRGLIFCNRNNEALELSRKFNELGYRTCAISGADSDDVRNNAIARLEAGELEYIFSVDIMNEGVDIPSLNQIVMLRRTDSAIVFVQQLGRGLRKCVNKEYTLVLDFIGNYQSNYLVPVALTGDKTYNKDRLRRLVQEGDSTIPGCSTVSFDRIAEARIYRAIDGGDFTATRFLENEYMDLRRQLGRIPTLEEFDRNGSIDPLLIFRKFGSYHAFLEKADSEYTTRFSSGQCGALKYISQKLANGKRSAELLMLKDLIGQHDSNHLSVDRACALTRATRQTVDSATAVLYGSFSSPKDFVSMVMEENGERKLTRSFVDMLQNEQFKQQILEAINFGLKRNQEKYSDLYEDTNFVLNEKYTYEEICRLFNWEKNQTPQNLGGYFYDKATNTYPVFINYDKAPDISESIQYEDKLLSDTHLRAISKGHRSMSSPEILRLKAWPENGMKTYLFMRKNKKDKGGKEFYFLGEMTPTGEFEPITTRSGDSAVEIYYQLKNPIRQDIYEFMLSDLNEDD